MENQLKHFFGLTELFQQANCDYSFFDLSRRVTEIPKAQFIAIEQNQAPYPFSMQRQAQIAISYWREKSEPWIWFLSFPLDERSLLNQAAIGDFIQHIAGRLEALNDALSTKEQEELNANPYLFTPSEDKKAFFHAQLTKKLGLAPSQYMAQVAAYCSTEQNWQQWQHLGLQGLADLCARATENKNDSLLLNALKHMPMTPKYALLGFLEHTELSTQLSEQLYKEFASLSCSNSADIFYLAALLRAMAGAEREIFNQALSLTFKQEHLHHKEILVGIAGRCWQALALEENLTSFLLILAKQKDPVFFQQIFSDLALLPSLRPNLFSILNGKAPEALLNALKELENNIKSKEK